MIKPAIRIQTMGEWQATIRVWPFSTEAGVAEDKKAVGDEFKTFGFKSDSFDDAAAKANLIVMGIRSNPRAWSVNIVKLAEKTH